MVSLLPHARRTATGLLLGGMTAIVEVFLLLAVAPAALVAVTRRRPLTGRITDLARTLTDLEQRRLARFLSGGVHAAAYGPGQAVGYLALRAPLGLLALILFLLLGYGVIAAVVIPAGWITGDIVAGFRPTPYLIGYLLIAGSVLLFLDLQGLAALATFERRLALRCLGPTRQEYELRIARLSESRADIITTVHEERRRIERDLHDGVQQQLVALGTLIGRARRATDGRVVRELLAEAHEQSQKALIELREVAWRIYPSALDDGGLPTAIEAVAARSPIPAAVECTVPGRPPLATDVVAYFVISEAITNAIKHSGAHRMHIAVHEHTGDGHQVVTTVRVADDGVGGADPAGPGLTGLRRRIEALDGDLTIDSPPGGPTIIHAALRSEADTHQSADAAKS
ncbi:sensor histidine kinase [Spongiactinospora rosea]|uniref:histidine kinase n=1 Tax=Spongiactinospora rosea TaxID=2248750 RepID=A0A366M1A9_9ACTN|nr:histidine kinase [Spongiactinospora rosea]RBQ19364.1 sensor histidine kinase [Spongiactinospora rosea]